MNTRNTRQEDLLNTDVFAEKNIVVVGVGAIGRQVALQLAAIGVGKIKLFDHDTVEEVNLGPQGFPPSDIGRPKVESVRDTCLRINPELDIDTAQERFMSIQFTSGVLFCCVDSISVRERIFRGVKHKCDLFVDGRMSAEYMRIFTVFDEDSISYYEKTLFAKNEAYTGSCTSRSTIYCANVAAGLMVAQFAKWTRKALLDMEVSMNLLTNESEVKNVC